LFELQQMLWDIRKDIALAARFQSEPDAVLDSYGINGIEHEAMRTLDFKSLYELGVNPYLLYFCALQIGVDRAEYYARIRGEV
jgi:Aromatic-ring-opening dioxygenase LigAB, LigA subunit